MGQDSGGPDMSAKAEAILQLLQELVGVNREALRVDRQRQSDNDGDDTENAENWQPRSMWNPGVTAAGSGGTSDLMASLAGPESGPTDDPVKKTVAAVAGRALLKAIAPPWAKPFI
jgi:hypothetical protein